MARLPADRAYPSQKRPVGRDLKDALPAGLPKNTGYLPCAFSGAVAVNGASPFQHRFSPYTKALSPAPSGAPSESSPFSRQSDDPCNPCIAFTAHSPSLPFLTIVGDTAWTAFPHIQPPLLYYINIVVCYQNYKLKCSAIVLNACTGKNDRRRKTCAPVCVST